MFKNLLGLAMVAVCVAAAPAAGAAATTTYYFQGAYTGSGTLPQSGPVTGEVVIENTPTTVFSNGDNFAVDSGYLQFGTGPDAIIQTFTPSSSGADTRTPGFFQIFIDASDSGVLDLVINGGATLTDPSPPYFPSLTGFDDTVDRYDTTSALGVALGGRVADFAFLDITSAPEPSTWLMMIAGVGLVGGAMRHRRAATASNLD
ncbi:MAG TPA: PEPxxWA-CTERM sorting domain-containing protein [Caulobacteraceae bacterium]|jgi:hypothetical protein|nr:PEPxxWA-CTERM sorting domain-containing protein [Caulobacteraceae bacterium]